MRDSVILDDLRNRCKTTVNYCSINLLKLTRTFVDILAATVIGTIVGDVVGLVLRKGSK